MRKLKPVIGTILAVVVTFSTVGTNICFAAGQEEYIEKVDEVVEETGILESSETSDPSEPAETAMLLDLSDFSGGPEDTCGGAVDYSSLENNISNSYEGEISGDLAVIIRGLKDGLQGGTFDAVDQYLPGVLGTGNSMSLDASEYVDAEKYNVNVQGYDSNHCWAATASNILWTTGYAQQATNPLTNEKFKSEDEVLAYFSDHFTDYAGRPSDAIEWFFDGQTKYTLNEVANVAHIIPEENVKCHDNCASGNLLSGVKHSAYMISVLNDASAMTATYSLASYGMGVLVRWLITKDDGKYGLSDDGHWATIAGIALDDDDSKSVYDRVKGIFIADSDNTPVNGALSATTTTSEELAAKKNQPNKYTMYKLTFDENLGVWGINNFYNGFGVITHLFGLMDSDKSPEGEDDDYDGISIEETTNGPSNVLLKKYLEKLNKGEIKVSEDETEIYVIVEQTADTFEPSEAEETYNPNLDEEVEVMIIKGFTEKDLTKKENIQRLRDYMIKNYMRVFATNDGKVDASKDYVVYLNAVDTMLYNLTVDDVMVPFNSYKIVDTKGNLSKLVLKKEYLETLSKGIHKVKISVENTEKPIEFKVSIL